MTKKTQRRKQLLRKAAAASASASATSLASSCSSNSDTNLLQILSSSPPSTDEESITNSDPINLIEEDEESISVNIKGDPELIIITPTAPTTSSKSNDDNNSIPNSDEVRVNNDRKCEDLETSLSTPNRIQQGQENEAEAGEGCGSMLIVGAEKFTSKIQSIYEERIETLHIKTVEELTLENSLRWKNENLVSILFVIDNSNLKTLKVIDDTLTELGQNYLMPMECIDFVLAKEHSKEQRASTIPPKDILLFINKFQRPLTTVVFDDGWRNDQFLKAQLQIFLHGFEDVSVTTANILSAFRVANVPPRSPSFRQQQQQQYEMEQRRRRQRPPRYGYMF